MKLAVYGTLKRGHSNHRYLYGTKYLGEFVTEPIYTMYSLGSFPAVRLNGKTGITVEVYETDNEEIINLINSLERYTGIKNDSANWYDCITIDTPYGLAEMFYQKKYAECAVLESGKWERRYEFCM